MCLLLNLRGVNNTLNYPKDTQLNTTNPDTNLRYSSSRLLRKSPAQPCNFFYPIDFVVKHPVAPEINPVPTLGWVRTVRFSALLKGQSPQRLSTLSSRVMSWRKHWKGLRPVSINPCSAPASPVQTWGTRRGFVASEGWWS
jgi:hypothetical protein